MIQKENSLAVIPPEQNPPFPTTPLDIPQQRPGKSRRMKLLEQQGCFHFGTKSITIQRATTADDLLAAYNLVHDTFQEEGRSFPHPTPQRMRIFQALPNTATFVAKNQNATVAVVSVVEDTPGLGLPSDNTCGQEIQALRRSASRICQIANLSIAPAFRRTAVLTELLRCCFAHLQAISCQQAITTFKPGHQAFYELMGFETIGTYLHDTDPNQTPTLLANLNLQKLFKIIDNVKFGENSDLATLKHYYLDSNPYLIQIEDWIAEAQQAFANAVFLRRLFVEMTNILVDSTPDELLVIREFWGENAWLDALGHTIIFDVFSPFY